MLADESCPVPQNSTCHHVHLSSAKVMSAQLRPKSSLRTRYLPCRRSFSTPLHRRCTGRLECTCIHLYPGPITVGIGKASPTSPCTCKSTVFYVMAFPFRYRLGMSPALEQAVSLADRRFTPYVYKISMLYQFKK